MVLKKVGKYVSTIAVNGTDQDSFIQLEDSTYDVDVSAVGGSDVAVAVTIGEGSDLSDTFSYDVKDDNGNVIISDSVTAGGTETYGTNLHVKGSANTPLSVEVTSGGGYDGADVYWTTVSPGASLSINSVTKS